MRSRLRVVLVCVCVCVCVCACAAFISVSVGIVAAQLPHRGLREPAHNRHSRELNPGLPSDTGNTSPLLSIECVAAWQCGSAAVCQCGSAAVW